MYNGMNKKRRVCTTVLIIEMIMYYGINKKPVEILYARYEYLK
jgi:hypothetical protein